MFKREEVGKCSNVTNNPNHNGYRDCSGAGDGAALQISNVVNVLENSEVLENGDKKDVENYHEGRGEDAEGEDRLQVLKEGGVAVGLLDVWQSIVLIAASNDRTLKFS